MSKYSLFWSVLHDPRTFKNDSSSSSSDDSSSSSSSSTSSNAVGSLHQDEDGDWYEVVEIEGTNAKGRNYGVDTSDNSSGPDLSQSVHSGGDDDNNATSVTVESGDTLSEIAESLDTSVGELMAANPNITNPNEIVVGQTINTTGVQTGVDTYEGMSADDFMTVSSDDDIMTEYDEYMAKLEAAGEADTSTLDEIAAADTTGIDVYEPTGDTAAAVTEYYTEGAGAPGATQTVDFTETSSGEDFTAAAESDTADIVGGTDYTTYFGETVEVRELPSGTKYYVDLEGKYVALAPEEDVTVDTFSDSETTTPVSEIAGPFDGTQTYEETVLEPGTGGISGIRLGDPMTPQLAAELGLSDIYQEGDVILAEDLIKLDELGFDVSQADLSGIDLKTGADAGTLTVTTGDGATATTAVQGSMADMQNYIEQLNQQVGGATFADLEAAGFDVDLIKQYNDTVSSVPGMPVEGTMLYSSLYGDDQGVYAGVEGGGEPGDAFDYEDYITQGGQFPLGGDDGLPDDFFSTDTPDTITLNGQQYAVGYAEGAIDPGIANEIRRAELDGFTTAQTLGNIAKAATSPIFQSLGMSVEGLARTGDTTVEAVVEAIQDSDNPIDFLNIFSTRVGEGARDVIYNLVGTENVPAAVTDFFGEEGSEAAPRPDDAEDFEFNMLNTLASNVYEPLYFIEEEIYNSIPAEFREGMEANQLVGDFQDLISGNIRTADGKTFLEAMKDSPGETSAQLLSNIGDVASDLLVLAITRSPGATALFGFGEGSQDARNSFQADLIQQATTGSLKDDPAFKALIQSEGSVENAVAALSDKFEKYAITAGGVEGVSDLLIYGVGSKIATKVLPNTLTQGALGTGLGVTAAAGTEGLTEGVQQFVSNVGVNDVLGVDLNTGRDVGTAFINALVPGAAAGIISAATTRYLSPKEVADIITNVESSTGQDLSALQAMLTSSDTISVTTDSDGNLQFTNTETGKAVTMPTASKVGAGAAAGTETNVTDITAAEILNSGNEIEYTTDDEGNSILTDKVTGDSVNLGTGSVVSGTDTTKVTGIAGVSGAAGVTGASGAQGAQGISSTKTTLSGSSTVDTVGDLEITTTVDNQGNTTVSTKNVVTGTTTADVVPAGTATVITNGTANVTVDTTTASTTGAITTVVDPTIDTTTAVDTTSTIDTTTATTTTTPIVSTTTSTTGDDDDFLATSDTVTTPTDTFTPDDGGDDDVVGETEPGYTSGIAGLGGGARPVVSPYYQPQQTGVYSFYTPQPGVTQTPAQPVFSEPQSYLAPTANPQYGYGYIAPNTDIEYLRRLAEIQGTGAEKLPSEDLMDGS